MTLKSVALTMAEDCSVALRSAVDTRGTSSPPSRSIQGVLTVEALANESSLPNSASLHELTSLVEGIRAGRESALEELYEATVGKLYALAAAILRSVEDSEEVVCETYAYAWANAARYDPRRANVLGWLLMLCRSRALDRLRQRRANAGIFNSIEPESAEALSGDRPEDLLSLLQQRSTLYAALSKLTPLRRRVVSLAFLQGLSHQQIAQATGLPLGTIKSHVRRALAQLRETLEET